MKRITEIAQIFLIIAAFGGILYLAPAEKAVQATNTNPPEKVSASKSTAP